MFSCSETLVNFASYGTFISVGRCGFVHCQAWDTLLSDIGKVIFAEYER